MPPDPQIYALAQQVGERFHRQGRTLAVAESCTGGLLGAALTDVPGSSVYFLGGVISYADPVKVEQLGVPDPTVPSTASGGGESVTTHRFQWTGDRWDNRHRSVIAALELLARAPEL